MMDDKLKLVICFVAIVLVSSVFAYTKISGDVDVDGTVLGSNTFLPQSIQVHDEGNFTPPSTSVWFNLTFEEVADVKQGITHTHDDGTNDTITINEGGLYRLSYLVSFEDSTASPTSSNAVRVTRNSVEIKGSVEEEDSFKQNSDQTIDHNFLANLTAGDEVRLQFITDNANVRVASHKLFGDDPITKELSMNKYSN